MKNMQIYQPHLHTCDQGNITPHSLIIEDHLHSHLLLSFILKKEKNGHAMHASKAN